MLAAILWGTEGTVTIYAPGVDAASMGIVALSMGACLQLCRAYKGVGRNRGRLYKQWPWILLGGFSAAAFPFTFLNSIRLSGIAIGTVVTMGSSPMFSALIERILDKQGFTKQWLMGFPLGLLGIILLSFMGVAHHTTVLNAHMMHPLEGCVLAVIAGLCFSLNSWTMHRLIEHHIPASAVTATVFMAGALIFLPYTIYAFPQIVASKAGLYVSFYIAVVIYLCAYMSFSFGLARIKTSTATVITLFEPVVATLLACTVAHEALSPTGWLGIALIFLCMIVMTLPSPSFKEKK